VQNIGGAKYIMAPNQIIGGAMAPWPPYRAPMSYSNFVRNTHEIFEFKNAVILKNGLGVVKVIENVTIR